MPVCPRCQDDTKNAEFCDDCLKWLKQQDKGLGNELASFLDKWEAWEAWCAANGQSPT